MQWIVEHTVASVGIQSETRRSHFFESTAFSEVHQVETLSSARLFDTNWPYGPEIWMLSVTYWCWLL